MQLKILTYNTFCRPNYLFKDGQRKRAKLIVKSLFEQNDKYKDIDIIVFCELFDDKSRKTVLKNSKKYGFNYQTKVIGNSKVIKRCCSALCSKNPRVLVENGGVVLVSKYPIILEDSVIYNNNEISGTDSLSAKGILYTKILKNNKNFHIFSTHMQAWHEKKDEIMRFSEARRINKLILDKKISNNESVFIIGDLNIDSIINKKEINHFKNIMNVQIPEIIGDQKFTSDPNTNQLVGRDGQKKPYREEWLDYCLFSISHFQPKSSSLECMPIKLNKPIKISNRYCGYIKTKDLSDHYPVLGTFIF
jgi:endonuclease/exonuclease/phosphatase family metal-dependent hydrolase